MGKARTTPAPSIGETTECPELSPLPRVKADPRVAQTHQNDAAVDQLVRVGYDPVYGARPLKRAIQRHVEDELATHIVEGRVKNGDRVRVDARDGTLEFEVVSQSEMKKRAAG